MPTAREYVDLADRLIEDDAAFDAAAQLLDWAAELEPTCHTFTLLTLCRLKGIESGKALEAARRAVELGPNDAEALNALGLALTAAMDYDEALATFRRAIETDPTRYAPYFNRAIAAFYVGRYDDAAGDFVRSFLVENALLSHRFTYSSVEPELQTADPVFHQIPRFRREAGPSAADAFRILAVVARYVAERGKLHGTAVRHLRVGSDLAWTAPLLHMFARAEWRTIATQRERLAGYLDRALAARPGDSALRWARAESKRFQDKDPHLREDLEFLVQRHPDCAEVRSRWISLLMSRKELDAALRHNDVLLAANPDSYADLHMRATLLEMKEEHGQALEIWNRLIDLYAEDTPDPAADSDDLYTSGSLYLDRADCEAELGYDSAAEQDFEKAIAFHEAERAQDDDGTFRIFNVARLRRGRYYAARGRWTDALGDLDQCVQETPGISHLYEERAKVRTAMGDAAGAQVDLDKVKELERARRAPPRKRKAR